MKLKTLLLTLLLSLGLTSVTNAEFGIMTPITDSDWNIRPWNDCGFPVTDGDNRNVRWVTEEGNKFLRIQVRKGNFGLCGKAPGKVSDTSRGMERAEFTYGSFPPTGANLQHIIDRNGKYQINFDVRIIKGFDNQHEVFFQLHSHAHNCYGYPPIQAIFRKFRLYMRHLTTSTPSSSYDYNYHKVKPRIESEDLQGGWNAFKMIFDTSYDNPEFELYINNEFITKLNYAIPKCSPNLTFKFGIYRDAEESNSTSIIDFDKILVRRLK